MEVVSNSKILEKRRTKTETMEPKWHFKMKYKKCKGEFDVWEPNLDKLKGRIKRWENKVDKIKNKVEIKEVNENEK